MISIKITDCPLFEKGAKRTRKPVTLETKTLVIRKMEAGEERANVCSSIGLAPATVSTVMANAEKNKTIDTQNYKTARIKCMYIIGSRRLMPPDALQPKANCTNPGL